MHNRPARSSRLVRPLVLLLLVPLLLPSAASSHEVVYCFGLAEISCEAFECRDATHCRTRRCDVWVYAPRPFPRCYGLRPELPPML